MYCSSAIQPGGLHPDTCVTAIAETLQEERHHVLETLEGLFVRTRHSSPSAVLDMLARQLCARRDPCPEEAKCAKPSDELSQPVRRLRQGRGSSGHLPRMQRGERIAASSFVRTEADMSRTVSSSEGGAAPSMKIRWTAGQRHGDSRVLHLRSHSVEGEAKMRLGPLKALEGGRRKEEGVGLVPPLVRQPCSNWRLRVSTDASKSCR